MKAYICTKYGPPEVLKLVELLKPIAKNEEVLIRNYSTTINSADTRLRSANPWIVRLMLGLTKPKYPVGGVVFSGRLVDEFGNETEKVCGLNFTTFGGFGQYLVNPKNKLYGKLPENISFEDGASILFGGHTALFFLRKVNIKKGDSILIYGASGSVGVATIQLAKYFGATVTAVCGTLNIDKVKALGADHVIDYQTTDLTTINEKFDIVYDTVGKNNEFTLAKLVKKGKSLILGAALVKGAIKGLLAKVKNKINIIITVAETNQEDIQFLIDLLEKGILTPAIDKTYTFEQMLEAHTYVDTGHKLGNVVVKIA